MAVDIVVVFRFDYVGGSWKTCTIRLHSSTRQVCKISRPLIRANTGSEANQEDPDTSVLTAMEKKRFEFPQQYGVAVISGGRMKGLKSRLYICKP